MGWSLTLTTGFCIIPPMGGWTQTMAILEPMGILPRSPARQLSNKYLGTEILGVPEYGTTQMWSWTKKGHPSGEANPSREEDPNPPQLPASSSFSPDEVVAGPSTMAPLDDFISHQELLKSGIQSGP